LPLALDVRDAEAIEAAVETAGRHVSGIDICINNASAIHLGDTRQVDAKRFDLMHQVNARAAYLVSRACVPWLIHSPNPHILMLSPPLDLRPEWVLRNVGVRDFDAYQYAPGETLTPDLFVAGR